jgi:hypothetical protein
MFKYNQGQDAHGRNAGVVITIRTISQNGRRNKPVQIKIPSAG